MRTAVSTALAALLLVAATEARAQQTTAQPSASQHFSVTPSLGVMHWDNASALANKEADASGSFSKSVMTPMIGLTANYNVWNGLGLGFYFDAARPTTRGDYFPAALLKYGSDVRLENVSQRVTTLLYGLQARYGFAIGSLTPYVSGGFGAMSTYTDPQQNTGNVIFHNSSSQLGGGLSYQLGGGSITLDLRNYTVFHWDRNKLNPVAPAEQNTTFPTANGNPPAPKSTINNLRFSIGFSFVPRVSTTEGTAEGQE